MSYRELYEYCQNLPIHISRKELTPNVCRLTGAPKPRVMLSGILDPKIVRGYFIVPGSTDHPFAHFAHAPGGAVIMVAREMNYCWKRFVEVKELMHLFDEPLQLVGDPELFQGLVNELAGPTPEPSHAYLSDYLAIWMALGVLCPEKQRQEFARMRTRGEIDDMTVAQRLKVPAQYVPHLFHPEFRRFLEGFK